MSTDSLPNDAPIDSTDELLVAYLDGELEPEQRAHLEQRLVDEADLRRRLQGLQGGWQLLDELPQATVGDQFTQTTLALVAADVARSRSANASKLRRWLRPLAVLLATAAMVLIGALFVQTGRQAQLQRQLSDLPVVEHLDAYLVADDLEWLEQVSQNERWRETVDAAEAAGAFGPAGLPASDSLLARTPPEERQHILSKLDPSERSRLDSAWQRFENLSPAKQDKVRQQAARVAAAEDGEHLLRTMEAYARLRANWSVETRTAIENGTPQERQKAFARALKDTRKLWLRDLSDADSEAIYEVLHVVATDWLERMDEERDGGAAWLRDQIPELADPDAQDRFEDRQAALLHHVFVRRRGMSMFRLTDDDLYAMKSVVDDSVREELDHFMPTPQMQKEVLYGWGIEAVQRKTKTVRVESLLSLPAQDRLEVELSPPDQMFPLLEHKSRDQQRLNAPAGPPRWGGRLEP